MPSDKKEERTRKFREKNERRKQEQSQYSPKELKEKRRWRRSLLHGAFGKKEETPITAE
jgi:hypothetical protein